MLNSSKFINFLFMFMNCSISLLRNHFVCAEVFSEKHLERLFLFSIMWSLGAVLELDDRAKMEEFVLKQSKLDWPKCKEDETIFEYVVGENGRWQHWGERVEEFFYPPDQVLEYSSILVPNVDNVRTNFLIQTIAKQNKAVLLIGEPGTAKTVMIKGYTSSFDPEYKLTKSFNFSSATTPNMVQVGNVSQRLKYGRQVRPGT